MNPVKVPSRISRRLIASALIVSGALMLMGYFKMPDNDPIEARDQDTCSFGKNAPTSASDWTPVPWPMDAGYFQFSPLLDTTYARVPRFAFGPMNCVPFGIRAGIIGAEVSGGTDLTRLIPTHDAGDLASTSTFAALPSTDEPSRDSWAVNVPCVEFLHSIVCP